MIVGDSELRREVFLKAMEAVTDLINGQCPGSTISNEKNGALMTVLTALAHETLPGQAGHGFAGNDF